MQQPGFVRIDIGRRPRGRRNRRRSLVIDLPGAVRVSFGDEVDPRVVHAVFAAVKRMGVRGPC